MGRGGGGGSSHSGSHHSSSHSHSGGSSYSSSGYSSSHHSGYSGSGGSGGGGVGFIGFVTYIFIFLFVIGAYFFVDDKNGGLRRYFVERSTIKREALPSDKCTKVLTWYKDDWGDWINEPGEDKALINGLVYFYEKTGVQPYVWIMGHEGKNYKSEGSVEELAESKYKDLFGNDEGHLLLIFREYPNESSNYIVTATPGHDAETVVMDEQAREILLDYIDLYYTSDSLNEGEFFAKAFTKAADRIMTKQLSVPQLVTIGAVVLIVVIGLIIVAKIVKKRKVAVAKHKAVQAQAVAAQKKTDFDRKKYEDQLETEYVSVECPNCGFTGNKIRRTTVDYCPFCGTAIRVDKDGKVEFGTSESEPVT